VKKFLLSPIHSGFSNFNKYFSVRLNLPPQWRHLANGQWSSYTMTTTTSSTLRCGQPHVAAEFVYRNGIWSVRIKYSFKVFITKIDPQNRLNRLITGWSAIQNYSIVGVLVRAVIVHYSQFFLLVHFHPDQFSVKRLKVKRYSSSCHLRATSDMGSHRRHPTQVNAPRLTPARQDGTPLTYTPRGRRLSWPRWPAT